MLGDRHLGTNTVDKGRRCSSGYPALQRNQGQWAREQQVRCIVSHVKGRPQSGMGEHVEDGHLTNSPKITCRRRIFGIRGRAKAASTLELPSSFDRRMP